MGTESDDFAPDPEEFENLPNTNVEVELHVHFGMAGSFPLRIAELFFADDGLYIAEYGYITPMFGLGTKKHHREADAMARVFEIHGLDEVLVQADKVLWYNYDTIERVRLDEGGRFGRPKLTVYGTNERSEAYRLHDADLDKLPTNIDDCLADHDVQFDHRTGLGFDPAENVRRFFS
ncbi:hypothetical protein [Haladaptatus halobius]|uniref:hypothetical protein n=1 Tax=Haladaptatus halobius TaxID=2884875 RepID=UPI001D0B606F|nr:hypothetical protein [Haladaptatus halobius]